MVVIKNEDNLVFFSVAHIPYDIKDIKLVSKPLIPPTYRQKEPHRKSSAIHQIRILKGRL